MEKLNVQKPIENSSCIKDDLVERIHLNVKYFLLGCLFASATARLVTTVEVGKTDDAFLAKIKMLCEPTKRSDPSATVGSEEVHENLWDAITVTDTEEKNFLINSDFFQISKIHVSPSPDFDAQEPSLSTHLAQLTAEPLMNLIFYRISTPYFVYRVVDSDARRLGFDQASVHKGKVSLGLRCLVALDNEGEVVEVLRRDQE